MQSLYLEQCGRIHLLRLFFLGKSIASNNIPTVVIVLISDMPFQAVDTNAPKNIPHRHI